MNMKKIRLLSLALALSLALSSPVRATQAEPVEEEPVQTTAPAETTVPAETVQTEPTMPAGFLGDASVEYGSRTLDAKKPLSDTASVIRCVYDSLAAEFARTAKDIEKITGRSYEKIYMFGGGTKDSLICRLTARASGKKVVAGPTEATSVGNALCAFVGSGVISSVKEARQIVIKAGMTREY